MEKLTKNSFPTEGDAPEGLDVKKHVGVANSQWHCEVLFG